MMLIQFTRGKGSTAYIFYNAEDKDSINFPEDQIYLNAL